MFPSRCSLEAVCWRSLRLSQWEELTKSLELQLSSSSNRPSRLWRDGNIIAVKSQLILVPQQSPFCSRWQANEEIWDYFTTLDMAASSLLLLQHSAAHREIALRANDRETLWWHIYLNLSGGNRMFSLRLSRVNLQYLAAASVCSGFR